MNLDRHVLSPSRGGKTISQHSNEMVQALARQGKGGGLEKEKGNCESFPRKAGVGSTRLDRKSNIEPGDDGPGLEGSGNGYNVSRVWVGLVGSGGNPAWIMQSPDKVI